MSLGKQDPPYAGPALKNLLPILLSVPIPMETSSIFTPIFSHKLANSFINVILVAKKAFEAYLINSAALLDVFIYFAPLEIRGEYKFLSILLDFLLFVPITILSGYIKSLIASPSLKNSGLETTLNKFFLLFLILFFLLYRRS